MAPLPSLSQAQIAEVLIDSEFKPELVQRITFRSREAPIEVVPPNPAWPQIFNEIKDRIIAALGKTAVAVNHTGSTSVPGLPAKDTIDIDLVVQDSTDEHAYVDALEKAGFSFLLREPHWHEHRFFYAYEPRAVNLHVWSPNCPEVVRHEIFRQRLLRCPEDMAMYKEAKELAARQTLEQSGSMVDYNLHKEGVIRKILRNAFVELGYLGKQ